MPLGKDQPSLSPSRLRKRVERALKVTWREQPTRYDIEALQANIRRVGLVIRVRWILIVVLVTYSLVAGALYATRMPVAELASLMWVPALALGFVVLYNTFYSMNYRRLGNIAVWNHLQLALDALVVTVLVYFSGGVHSWFWSMYALFILEAAFILPRSRDVWLISLLSMVLLGSIEGLDYFVVLPHAVIPFAPEDLHNDALFVSVRYLWQVAVLAGTAWISNSLVGELRRDAAARSQTILDATTRAYSRGYFMRVYPAEVRRASRDARPLHILYLDVDRFGSFNDRFGIDAGDRMLKAIAHKIAEVVAPSGDESSLNVVARIGGEEFAVLVVEDPNAGGSSSAEHALALAEKVRAAIEALRVDNAGVTVSVGVATMPDHGSSTDELLDAADDALARAVAAGGNCVRAATESPVDGARSVSPDDSEG
jgi:diguanylate cyclase (GGDEF)-like protein